MDKIEFGKYLRELRGKKSTRQIEILTGVSKSYLSLIERGERDIPSPDVLRKLSGIYKVPYEKLMSLAGYLDAPDNEKFIVKENELPYELQNIGIEEIKVAKEIIESGFTTDEVKEIFEFAKKVRKKP